MAFTYVDNSSIPNAGSEYYWTVVAKEEIGTGGSSPEDGYVAITSSFKRVNLKHEVKYYIRAYKLVSGIPQILNDESVQVAIPQSYRDSIANDVTIGTIISTNEESTLFGDKNLFIVGFQGKTSGYTFTPKFLVTLKPNSPENNTALSKEVFPTTGLNGVPRTITFTTAKVPPQIPQNIKNEAAVGSLQDLITLDVCVTPNKWVALVLKDKTDGRYVYIKTYNLDGSFVSQEYVGKDEVGGTGRPGPDKIKHYELGRKKVIRLKAKECFKDDDPAVPDTSILPPPNLDKVIYNPPNHFVTRSVSHAERTVERLDKSGAIIVSDVQARQALDNRNNRLGKIYQSKDGAKALNRVEKNGKRPIYGFKFSYNPTFLNYGTDVNTSIDWMLYSKDPANLLGGNTTVDIELRLNRIADMTELKNFRGQPYSKNYPTALTPEQVEGIVRRGTEYDLEFLYRVVNGSPGKTALLTYPGVTSDFGYITGTPCWFHLHDNLRYYGSVTSLKVQHLMFTSEMVPMLSIINLSFIRYPSLDLAPEEVKAKYQENASKVASTGEEPSTS